MIALIGLPDPDDHAAVLVAAWDIRESVKRRALRRLDKDLHGKRVSHRVRMLRLLYLEVAELRKVFEVGRSLSERDFRRKLPEYLRGRMKELEADAHSTDDYIR